MIRLHLLLTLAFSALVPAARLAATEPDAEAARAVARYLEARGGEARWQRLRALALRGTYATFSQKAPFALFRARPDRYRLDYWTLDQPAVRARDAHGPWWQQPLLGLAAPARVDAAPVLTQLAREAIFGPPLLGLADRGITVGHEGRGDVDGRPTVVLSVTFPDAGSERWHLDADTYLEVMIEATVHDFTQGPRAMTQRTYFDDFRDTDGLVLPHRLEIEFGARLEVMDIESVDLDPDLADDAFDLPDS